MRKTLLPLLLICSVTLLNCRKTEVHEQVKVIDDRQARFFNVTSTTSPQAKAIAAAIRRQETQAPFVNNLINKAGYPRWDKARIVSYDKKSITGRSSTDSSNGETVYIPFVLDSQNTTNAVLAVRLNNPDTSYRLLYAKGYRQFGFDTANRTKWNARDVFHLFSTFDYLLFGHTKFRVLDKNLFKAPNDKLQVILTLKARNGVPITGRAANVVEVTECTDYWICYVTTLLPARTNGQLQCNISTVCTTYSYYDGSGGSGTGSGGTGGTGGGGTGNTGGGGSGGGWSGGGGGNPCGGNATRTSVVPTDECDPGWRFESDDTQYFNPYSADTVRIDTSLRNNFPCVSNIINSLSQYSNVNALAQVALHTVFGVNKKLHLNFTLNPSWGKNDPDGDTHGSIPPFESGIDFVATIRLNPWVLRNSTQEYIAATIIHEAVHAYIGFKHYQYTHGLIDSTSFKSLFPLYWPPSFTYQSNSIYYYQMGNKPEHQAMAANLIEIMFAPLVSLFPNPSIDPVLRDSIYKGITWGGLEKTPVFKARSDTSSIQARNLIARDTTIHAPFDLSNNPGVIYNYDAHNLNMKKGCQ